MTQSELCACVAARPSLSKTEAAAALGALASTIADALAEGETVTVAGFGKLAARSRAARQGRNPRTGEPVAVPAARVPSFKAAKALRNTRSTLSEPSPVESYPDLVPAARTRHLSAFATVPHRHATAAMRECPTRDRVTFGAGRRGQELADSPEVRRPAQTSHRHRILCARVSLFGRAAGLLRRRAGACARLMPHLLPSRFRRLPSCPKAGRLRAGEPRFRTCIAHREQCPQQPSRPVRSARLGRARRSRSTTSGASPNIGSVRELGEHP